jgi:GNAT superfamily N-acetyltransferase
MSAAAIAIRRLTPEDAGLLQDFVRRLAPDSRYRRFHTGFAELPPGLLRAMTRLDPARGRAFVAVMLGDGGETIVGEARYGVSPDDPAAAEIGLVVAEAWRRRGLATALLERLMAEARAAGIATFYGEVLAGNAPTLAFAVKHGFAARPDLEDRRLVRIERAIAERAGASALASGRAAWHSPVIRDAGATHGPALPHSVERVRPEHDRP